MKEPDWYGTIGGNRAAVVPVGGLVSVCYAVSGRRKAPVPVRSAVVNGSVSAIVRVSVSLVVVCVALLV